ncbi:MAG: DNA-binding GntR family transcriptional regulator [Saprospiraceae bacterium]|jgi:DNA-binding GntR family transcriptional regulator
MKSTNNLTETLRAKTQTSLRDAILNGRYHAGQKLIERELCDLTGASRSILREALVNLEASGLIERQSYCGFTVSALSVKKVVEIFELRGALETMAAQLFTDRASDLEIDDLKAALQKLEIALAEANSESMRIAKEVYYDVLFTGCRNNEIRLALEKVIDRITFLRNQLLMDEARRAASLIEIQQLTDALVARDRVAAKIACLAHLDGAREAVLKQMAKQVH